MRVWTISGWAGVAAALSMGLHDASAQSFRCKSDLANVGDSRASVLNKCGEPVVKDSFCRPAKAPTGVAPGVAVVQLPACDPVEEWTYNPGYGQFMTTLQFDAGRLTAIIYGERVK